MTDEIKTNFHAMRILQKAQVFMPAVVPGLGVGGFYVFSAAKRLGHGATIQAAMEAAGFWPFPADIPDAPFFRADEYTVRRGGEQVAIANSKTMAKRVANALNAYSPDERCK